MTRDPQSDFLPALDRPTCCVLNGPDLKSKLEELRKEGAIVEQQETVSGHPGQWRLMWRWKKS